MKVIVPEALFSDESVAGPPFFLESLFDTCSRRRHQLEVDPHNSPVFEQWRQNLPKPTQRELVDVVLRTSSQLEARAPSECFVVVCDRSSDWTTSPVRVGPEDLVPLLNAPLTILVEHEQNDAAFVKAVGFGFEHRDFLKYCKEGRIVFDHGGGSSMRAVIEQRGQLPQRALRMWAIFDSDALVAGKPSNEARQKVESCNRNLVRHHLLERRAIENYLPPDEISRLIPHSRKNIDKRKAAGAFGRLSSVARAHYNLKGGFAGDATRLESGGKDHDQSAAVLAQFSDVAASDRVALENGFGSDVADLFAPANDLSPQRISEESRRRDGQEAEMVHLFRAILRWL